MDEMITMKISSLYRYFISILFIVLTIILNTVTYARPVSYEDGWTAMMMSDEMIVLQYCSMQIKDGCVCATRRGAGRTTEKTWDYVDYVRRLETT